MAGNFLTTVVGDHDLCAWQAVRGVVWVQTRNSEHARRLARRQDGRLVACGVAGGILKTFEITQPLSWAIRLMARYTANKMVTNTALGRALCPKTTRSIARGDS